MSVQLFMDVHVPGPITEGLRRRGVDVLTAQEDGSDRVPDDLLLERSKLLGRVLFKRDEDFLVITAHYLEQGLDFTGVVYAHQNLTNWRRVLDDLEVIALASDLSYWQNRVQHLPL